VVLQPSRTVLDGRSLKYGGRAQANPMPKGHIWGYAGITKRKVVAESVPTRKGKIIGHWYPRTENAQLTTGSFVFLS